MATYIEREALMKFPIRIDHYDKENGNEHFVLGIETVLEYAETLPAADVVAVVRCKDCRRRHDPDECPMCYLIWGEHQDYTDDNGFCDRGERRGDSG